MSRRIRAGSASSWWSAHHLPAADGTALDRGRPQCPLDQQIASSGSLRPAPDPGADRPIEKFAPYSVYVAPVIQLVFFGFGGLVISGIAFAVFSAAMGGDATFKQTFAVVAHSGVILARPLAVHDAAGLRTRVALERDQPGGLSAVSRRQLVPGAAARLDRSDLHLVDAEPLDRARRPLPQAYRADRDHVAARLRRDRRRSSRPSKRPRSGV